MSIDREIYKDFFAKTLITVLIIVIVAFLTPDFRVDGIWILLVSSGLISLINFLLQSFSKLDKNILTRGLTGFLLSAIILLLTKRIMAGFNISTVGVIIGSMAIGIIDIIIPVSGV